MKWNYKEVTCTDCGISKSIRIDQYNRIIKINRDYYCKSCGVYHRTLIDRKRKEFDYSKLDWPNNKNNPRNSLYERWQQMRKRCLPNSKTHKKWYYDIGIYVDEIWTEYEPFRQWALANGYKQELELDRINPCGPYSPDNCRWVTHKENCNNKRPKEFRKNKEELFVVK
jgi:hypothetical protein